MQFIGLLPFFPVCSHPPNTTNGLKGRWPRILFLTPARNLIVQLMFELNVWNCVIFAGINVCWCTGKTLLKSHVIGILILNLSFCQSNFLVCCRVSFLRPSFTVTNDLINVNQYSENPYYIYYGAANIFSWPYIQYYFGGLWPLQKLVLSTFTPPFQTWFGVHQPFYKIHFPPWPKFKWFVDFHSPPPPKSLQNYFSGSGTWHFDDFQDNFEIAIILLSYDLVLPPSLPIVQNEFGDLDLCNIVGVPLETPLIELWFFWSKTRNIIWRYHSYLVCHVTFGRSSHWPFTNVAQNISRVLTSNTRHIMALI